MGSCIDAGRDCRFGGVRILAKTVANTAPLHSDDPETAGTVEKNDFPQNVTWCGVLKRPPTRTIEFLAKGSCLNSTGNSYQGGPGGTKNRSHSNFQNIHSLSQENQASLLVSS